MYPLLVVPLHAAVARRRNHQTAASDPDFQSALKARRREVWTTSIDRVRSLVPHALDTVEHALVVNNDARAAIALLRLAGLDAVARDRFGTTDATVIREEAQPQSQTFAGGLRKPLPRGRGFREMPSMQLESGPQGA